MSSSTPEQYPPTEATSTQQRPNGVWGQRSRREVRIVVFGSLLAVLALIIVVAVIASGDGGDDGNNSGSVAYQRPVEETVVLAEPQAKLEVLRARLAEFDVTRPYLQTIPATADALKSTTSTAPAEVQAASWLVHVDEHNEQHQLARRFALAVLYYNNGGSTWTDRTNWLSSDTHCNWYGITCCGGHTGVLCGTKPVNAVAELDLYGNNLSSAIPDSLVLLQELQALYLSKNTLTGTIPGEAFRQMPDLFKIYLQHNKLSGTVPTVLTELEKLGTLLLYRKDFDWFACHAAFIPLTHIPFQILSLYKATI